MKSSAPNIDNNRKEKKNNRLPPSAFYSGFNSNYLIVYRTWKHAQEAEDDLKPAVLLFFCLIQGFHLIKNNTKHELYIIHNMLRISVDNLRSSLISKATLTKFPLLF